MIFSLRQLQEKCREQQKPLYIAFIDLTKAFDLEGRSGLFSLLRENGCPPKLLQMVMYFHEDMHSTVCFIGGTSDTFPVSSRVKQGCVLAPTLFGIFFFMLLQYAFDDCTKGIYIRTRADGKLYNLARLRAKSKVREVLIRELLFADDAALTSHREAGLQELVDCLSHACREFGLTISLKKTTSWHKTLPPHQTSPLTERTLRWWTPSPTLVQPSPVPSPWTQRSARGLEGLPPQWPS